MIYPNWIYYPDDDLELFIDTVQQVSYVTSTDHQEYKGAIDGRSKIKATQSLPTATFECTWDTNHIKDIYRYLEYLRGKEVIMAFGPQNLASYVKIVEASIPWTIGTVQKVSLSVQFLGNVRGQFWEAESDDMISSGTEIPIDSDSIASGGQSRDFESGYWGSVSIDQSDIVLPPGEYTYFIRAKKVSSNATLTRSIYNNNDMTAIANEDISLTSTSYKIITVDFTVSSTDAGDEIRFWIGNSGSYAFKVDFLGFVAKP